VLLAAGMDVNTLASGFLLAIGAIPGAIVGARVNQASGRQLLIERAADRI
jgi:uncharacterized membrane protein YfcA